MLKRFLNTRGLGLTEVLIAAGLVGAIALSIPTITQMATKTSQTAQVNISWQLKRMQVEDSIQTIDGCQNSLVSDPSGGTPYKFGDTVQRIRSKTSGGGSVLLTNGASYPSSNHPEYTITNMVLVDKSGGSYGPNTQGALKISVKWERDMAGKGKGSVTDFEFPIEVATTGAAVAFTGCRGRDSSFTVTDACVDLFGGNLVDITGSGDYRCLNIKGYQGTTTPLDQNTAVGSDALLNLAASKGAVALGQGALQSLTNGDGNTAVGYQALNLSTNTVQNTAIGYQALKADTYYGNVAIGYKAATNQTSGYNVFIGNEVNSGATSDTSNSVAIGNLALMSDQSWDNVAIGSRSMKNTNGWFASANVAVGSSTLETNTDGTENVAIGYYSLYANTTGSRNVAVGMNSLWKNTTSNDSVAVGYHAMMNTTSTSEQTAVGSNSLYSNTTGSANTAIGQGTLYRNTTGTWNTAVGDGALFNNTTNFGSTAVGGLALSMANSSGQNTAMGYISMMNTTTGGRNAAYGASSLEYNTTGDDNTALGFYAAYRNTTGSTNTAVGTYSLLSNQTGVQNVGVGYGSLYSITDRWNTGIGYTAMYNMTGASGYSNTALGAYAMTGPTSGYGNTAIGVNAMRWSGSAGNLNTYVGTEAGGLSNGGSYNVAVGYQGLMGSAAWNGSWNTCIGALCQFNKAAGSNWLEIRAGSGDFYKLIQGDASGWNKVYLHGDVEAKYGPWWTEIKAGLFTVMSDRRLKYDIRPYPTGLTDIMKLKIKYYKRIKPDDVGEKRPMNKNDLKRYQVDSVGVIAQEVLETMPNAVFMTSDGKYSIDQNYIFFAGIKAIQEQQIEIEKNEKILRIIKEGHEQQLENHEERISELELTNAKLKVENEKIKKELDSIKKMLSTLTKNK